MLSKLTIAGVFHLLIGASLCAQAPNGFRWLDLKAENPEMTVVTKLLPKAEYTTIRRVGVLSDHALAFATLHDATEPQTIPADDMVKIYDIPLTGGPARAILNGYHIRHEQWIQFEPGAKDLGLAYYDCWECESSSIFTALHFDTKSGWIARWSGNAELAEELTPGVCYMVSDDGDPDLIVDQVFAVIAPTDDDAIVGTWFHLANTHTHTTEDMVMKCSVDLKTHKDVCIELKGAVSTSWERTICSSPDAIPSLSLGQKTKSCQRVRTTVPSPSH